MPRDTLTSSPRRAARRPAPRLPGQREHRLDLAALRPDARDEERQPGAIGRIGASSSGAVAPTTSPTVPPGPQPARAARRAPRAARQARRPSSAHAQALELGRAGVRGAAQHVGEPVDALEERRERLLAEVRVDRDRVRAEAHRTRRPPAARPSSRCRRAWRPDHRDIPGDRGQQDQPVEQGSTYCWPRSPGISR